MRAKFVKTAVKVPLCTIEEGNGITRAGKFSTSLICIEWAGRRHGQLLVGRSVHRCGMCSLGRPRRPLSLLSTLSNLIMQLTPVSSTFDVLLAMNLIVKMMSIEVKYSVESYLTILVVHANSARYDG